MPVTRHASQTNAHGERGFSVIEVVLAMVLLAAVVGGGVMAIQATNSLTQRAQTRTHFSTAAEAIYERMNSDRAWMKGCAAAGSECLTGNMPGAKSAYLDKLVGDLRRDDRLGIKTGDVDVFIRASAIDDAADRQGKLDEDGIVPDHYDVHITLEMKAGTESSGRLGTIQPITMTRTIDTTSSAATGSLQVQICAAYNQVDERMSIVGCDQAATYDFLRMANCPTNTKQLCKGLGSSTLDAKRRLDPSRFVAVTPVDTKVKFRLQHLTETGWKKSHTYGQKSAPGTWLFRSVPEGEVRIVLEDKPEDLQIWRSKNIPSITKAGELRATVEARRRSRALVMLSRPDKGKFTVRFQRTTRTFNWTKTTSSGGGSFSTTNPDGDSVSYTMSTSFTYMVYSHTTLPTRQGAATNAWFSMRPMPYGRFAGLHKDPGTGEMVTYTPQYFGSVKQFQKKMTFRYSSRLDEKSDSIEPTGQPYQLPTGLSTREIFHFQNTDGAKATWSKLNIGGPSGNYQPYVWIHPQTGKYTPSGVTWHGTGECYDTYPGATPHMQPKSCSTCTLRYGGKVFENPSGCKVLIGYSVSRSVSGGTGGGGFSTSWKGASGTPITVKVPSTPANGIPSQTISSHGGGA